MDSPKMTIKEWRLAKGISKEALAAACGVSVPTIYHWEKKPGSIRTDKLFALVEALDITVNDLKLF